MPQGIRRDSRRDSGERFDPGDSVGEPPADDCPKCLRRWSTAGSFGCLDPQSRGDEVNIEDLIDGDGRGYVNVHAGEAIVDSGRYGESGAVIGDSTVGHRVMSDAGMSTVEYAVGTVVAAAFAAVLYKIVTGDSVIAGLTNLINTALSTTF